MIIECKFCYGSGSVITGGILGVKEVCPACKGAGEFNVVNRSDYTSCKHCNGNGFVISGGILGVRRVCPACKGLGMIERPKIGMKKLRKDNNANVVILPQTPRLNHYDYDIAVSFAGEDRKIVENYCDQLSLHGLKVFYDEYEKVDLWGKNLYDKLDEIYRTKALACVIFISKNYAVKVWTNHERQSAQARALLENKEYILPVKIDDTEIPGIPHTIGYIDLRKTTIKELTDITIKKVKLLRSKL